MANEIRCYDNLVGGLIEDNPLATAATTLTSAGLASLRAIDTTNHAVIVLDPDGLTGAPYAKRITAHTASATTATIEAAALWGTARDVARDTPWVHAICKEDFEYRDYTPVVSQNGTRTTSSLVARYRQLGKHVHCWGRATISNAGTAANPIKVTLPIITHASVTSEGPIGTGWVLDAGSNSYYCIVIAESNNLMQFQDPNNIANQNGIGATPSFAVASGDQVHWNVTYEIA